MADTVTETVELLYSIDQQNLTVDQQIALAQAYASLAQAERLELIQQRLYNIHQVISRWAMHATTADGPAR
ncbi:MULTISPECIES: hypothetical protein [unclassified Solwaraspora]|uniref:hypothetical protein n=1 Tax=unclassified Solwaraspora TaxID=2627926 RepID=UPI00259B5602|nr:hypothetical protein [Solwaraspora sp. WMMA2056]WJK42025.1 hypothetical protein O7608_06420 [Solwaraspora sp. WMMA2056]